MLYHFHHISWQITSEFLLVSLLFHLVNFMQIASSSLIEIFFSAKGICEYHYSSSSSRMLHYSNLFLFFFSFFRYCILASTQQRPGSLPEHIQANNVATTYTLSTSQNT